MKVITLGLAGGIIASCLSDIFEIKQPYTSVIGGVLAMVLFFLTGDFIDV